jgi:hypothetical protein
LDSKSEEIPAHNHFTLHLLLEDIFISYHFRKSREIIYTTPNNDERTDQQFFQSYYGVRCAFIARMNNAVKMAGYGITLSLQRRKMPHK